MREIFFAREEPDERTAPLRRVIANGTAEHGMTRLECVEDGSHGGWPFELDFDLAPDAGERAEVLRKDDADHDHTLRPEAQGSGLTATNDVGGGPETHGSANAGSGRPHGPLALGRQLQPYSNVCTSTDRTGGRSWTMAFQVSPPSGDAYTCPPVVPKYTPQASSESTAMASRSTFT